MNFIQNIFNRKSKDILIRNNTKLTFKINGRLTRKKKKMLIDIIDIAIMPYYKKHQGLINNKQFVEEIEDIKITLR